MTKEVELYESLDIQKLNECVGFKHSDDSYLYKEGPIDYVFLFLEIKSKFPPTNCILKLQYTLDTDNVIKYSTINFIKYRKNFIYENGLYILYFDVVSEIPKNVNLINVKFENKRDEETTHQSAQNR